MQQLAEFFKPAIAFWRGRFYFVVGILLYLVSTVWTKPFGNVTQSRLWYHDIIDNGVGNLGIVAKTVLIAGIIYVVLFNLIDSMWTSKLKDDLNVILSNIIDKISLGIDSMTNISVINWINLRRCQSQDYKNIGITALTAYYGQHVNANQSNFKFICDNLLDRFCTENAVTREEFHDLITIKKIDGQTNLKWEEEKSYTLVCAAGSGTHKLRGYTRCRAGQSDVESLLNTIDFLVEVDNETIFSLKDWINKNRQILGDLTVTRKVSDGDGEVSFDGHWLTLKFPVTVKIKKQKTFIRMVDRSYIIPDDRTLNLIIDQPTYKFKFTMRLEGADRHDWSLMEPLIGASWYHSDAEALVRKLNDRWVSAEVSTWVLPGIALVAEWTAPPP